MLVRHGAVSREAVESMARNGARADRLCIAISGVAGPGGGTPTKPVGTVWIAAALGGGIVARRFHFAGSRDEVRGRAVVWAMALARGLLDRAAGSRPDRPHAVP